MSGFKDKSLNAKIAKNMLEKIISKVLSCCELMLTDCRSESKKINNHEEDIRDYLLHNYLDNDHIREKVGLREFLFTPEVPENYMDDKPKGRVDLKVISVDTFSFRDKYFIFECKRIDGSKTLNRAYLKDGVNRFVGDSPPLYSSYYKRNCMFGFVVKNIDIGLNTNKINQLQNEEYPAISVKNEMVADRKFLHTYISCYWVDHTEIKLHHLFYDFSSIIR
ncbi:hypothetical protein WMZ97_12340 [Lentibacillus sp. N15]|uniref:hypothetical protein n=1 Tax=Lentibacillus songyuanensis TaxID=3136161 RepID=UPI0031BB761E